MKRYRIGTQGAMGREVRGEYHQEEPRAAKVIETLNEMIDDRVGFTFTLTYEEVCEDWVMKALGYAWARAKAAGFTVDQVWRNDPDATLECTINYFEPMRED